MRSFLTGSRVYGVPNEKSDVDLVVLVSTEDAAILWANRDTSLDTAFNQYNGSPTLRYGDLNLMAILDNEEGRKQFAIWRAVTEQLKALAPVTKDQAIAAFDEAGRTYTNLGL